MQCSARGSDYADAVFVQSSASHQTDNVACRQVNAVHKFARRSDHTVVASGGAHANASARAVLSQSGHCQPALRCIAMYPVGRRAVPALQQPGKLRPCKGEAS